MSELDWLHIANNWTTDVVSYDEFFGRDVDADPAQIDQLSHILAKYRLEQRPKSQQSTLELREDVDTLGTKLRLLEAKISIHGAAIEELEFRANSAPFEKHLDEVLNYVTETFKELDFVTEIHYTPLEDGIFELTVIHNMKDRVEALESTHKKFLSVESAFSDVDFEMILLHKDEIQPDHLMGTKPIFSKTRSGM